MNSDSPSDASKECSTGQSTLTGSLEHPQNVTEPSLSNFRPAVVLGDVSLVQQILQSGLLNVNEKVFEGCTALHLACTLGNLEIVKMLVEQGKCDIECSSDSGKQPIHYAALNCHSNVLEYLYSQNCDRNVIDNTGNSVLHLLEPGWQGFDDCWSIVLANFPEQGNTPNNHGTTPLHTLVLHDRLDLVVQLVEHGPDVNLQDALGRTALHCLSTKILINPGNAQWIVGLQYLVDSTDPSILSKFGETAFEALQSAGMPVTPLIVHIVLVHTCTFSCMQVS